MREPDPQNPPGYIEKYALPGVKADEPAPVIRLQYEKNNRRDNRHIGQHSGHIIGES